MDEKRVQDWNEQREQLESQHGKKRRLEGGGRKPILTDVMEEELAAWIDSTRAQNLCVTRSNVESKALEITHAQGNAEFHTSQGCVDNFLRQQSFSLRRRTTVSQNLPQDLIDKVVGFIMMTQKLRHRKSYPTSSIGNMDEMPLWLDMPGETTITRTGDRSVPVRTTGHAREGSQLFLLQWLMGES